MSSSLPFSSLLFTILFCITLSIVAQAAVSPSNTFSYVNDGNYGEYKTENGASYRLLFQAPNLAMCFYNTTPGVYTLGLRMGSRPEDSTYNIMRWIWDANRGNPVGENATLKFGRDGNLVLAHADGKVAWQTGTTNKGVVRLELLPNGNLVLVDSRGRFVWQSFHYPTDTLMVGQGLRSSGIKELFSRVSKVDGSKGRYSFVLEKQRLALYVTSVNSLKRTPYYTYTEVASGKSFINSFVLGSSPVADGYHQVTFDYYIDNQATSASFRLARPKYNTTLSFLRLESDGNLLMYTYHDEQISNAWEISYKLFDKQGGMSLSQCKLPGRCGALGVCMNEQCVRCPTPKGLLRWDETCAPPALPPCIKNSTPNKVSYYKVAGVEHFTSRYTEGDGPVKVNECREKCNNDCACVSFFYMEESSKCYLAYELGTLTQVSNKAHVAYIKVPK